MGSRLPYRSPTFRQHILFQKLGRLCGPQQYTKYTIYTKIQNMNYGIYRYNKTNVFVLNLFDLLRFCFQKNRFLLENFENRLACSVYLVLQTVILNIGFEFVVFICIWEHILKVLFDICWKMSQKCEQVSYKRILQDLWGILQRNLYIHSKV